jgi:glycosyltransferase involved in cell wall biosynthesis
MNILFIVPGFGLGGTTTALASLLNCGLADVYDIDVFAISRRCYNLQPVVSHDIGLNGLTTAYYGDFSCFHTKDKLKYLFIKLLKQKQGGSFKLEEWIARKSIKKIERKKKYDVVIGFQEGLATRFSSHFSCSRKIAWIHCDYANTYGEEMDELNLYNCFEKVVCVSQFTRQGFVGRYPALAEKTVAIHNIFDAESVIERSKATIDDTRFDTSRFTIISLGRVHGVKRFYLIPEIAVQLKEAGLDFRWYILGSAGIPSELQRLMDAIQRNGMEGNVIYLGGKANPYPYLKAANLLVSISKSEACPMIFNEAKILHVPIVSADFGSAFEFIEDGKTGIISPLSDIPNAIMRIISDEELREKIKRNISQFEFDNTEIITSIKSIL